MDGGKEKKKTPNRVGDECEDRVDKGEAVNTRSPDQKTSKHEGVAYISGLSRWRWAQADPPRDSRGLHSLPRSPTRFWRCWRFWPALKKKEKIMLLKYDLEISFFFHFMNYWWGTTIQPIKVFKVWCKSLHLRQTGNQLINDLCPSAYWTVQQYAWPST